MSKKIGGILAGLTIFFLCAVHTVSALDFGQAYIRFDRMQTSSAISGLVCAKPSSAGAGTEAKVQIIFPSGFSVSQTAGNFTSGTANIPSGTTAWPSVSSSAVSVSGETVTFSGADLSSASATYCFTFIGASSTTASTTGNKNGYIRTLASDDTVINSTQYGVVLSSADQATVTATVPADSTDFQAELTKLTAGTEFNQNTDIEYMITYGSTLTYQSEITVEAEWSRGTIQGEGSPSVDILDYKTGSAGNAYGSTAPVIDTVNRKISWTISAFPANTSGQTVSFTLKTNASYTGSNTVSFSVSGRVKGPGTQTADSTITSNYLYNPPATPTPTVTPTLTPTSATIPTPTRGPTATPGQGPSATPTPQLPTQIPTSKVPQTGIFEFRTIEIDAIASDSAEVRIATSAESAVQLLYGTSEVIEENARTSVTSSDFYNQHTVFIQNLQPNTRYYFTVTARNREGRLIRSDIYTFITALPGKKPEFIGSSLVVTSQKVLLYSSALFQNYGLQPVLVSLPNKTPYEIHFKFEKSDLVEHSLLFARSIRTSAEYEIHSDQVEMTELVRNVFSGKLRANAIPGPYEIVVKVTDINGNIFNQHIADIKIIPPITVYESVRRYPVEHAKILLYVYNEATRTYQVVENNSVPIPNPSFTSANGESALVLPHGRYKIDVSATGYISQTIPFSLGPAEGQDYPQVLLVKEPFNLLTKIKYFYGTLIDAFSATQNFLLELAASIRFFELISLGITIAILYMILLALSVKLKVPLHSLKDSLLHRVATHPAFGAESGLFYATVAEKGNGKPIAGADIFLLNKKNKILHHTRSDKKGEFRFRVAMQKDLPLEYNVEIMAEGFSPAIYNIHESSGRIFQLSTSDQANISVRNVNHYVRDIASAGFEMFLILACLLEIVIGSILGWQKVIVFVLASAAAIVLWFRRMEKK